MNETRFTPIKALGFMPGAFFYLCVMYSQTSLADRVSDIPFWQKSEGVWLSENTYLSPEFEARIKKYHSIVEITLGKNHVTTKETKYYPAGTFNASYLGLDIDTSKGVEYVQVTEGLLSSGTTLTLTPGEQSDSEIRTQIKIIDDSSALMSVTHHYDDELRKSDAYRMFISLPTRDYRYISSFGIHSDSRYGSKGALRGVSIFSGKRIGKESIEFQKQALRTKYSVATIVTKNQNGYETDVPEKNALEKNVIE